MKRRIMFAALLLLTGLLAACANQTGNNEEAMISIVEKFQNARNDGNWELAATYLADDVVWNIPQGSLTGRDTWLATLKAEDTVPSSIQEDVKSRRVEGNTVIVEMIVTGPDFQSPAVAEVVVQDGKIQSYIVTAP
jgi:SnoaL-like domain